LAVVGSQPPNTGIEDECAESTPHVFELGQRADTKLI
jgi:hypothetical protein